MSGSESGMARTREIDLHPTSGSQALRMHALMTRHHRCHGIGWDQGLCWFSIQAVNEAKRPTEAFGEACSVGTLNRLAKTLDGR
jgi:hypothetical protein